LAPSVSPAHSLSHRPSPLLFSRPCSVGCLSAPDESRPTMSRPLPSSISSYKVTAPTRHTVLILRRLFLLVSTPVVAAL
jgi:hypothetical protein